MRTAAELVEHSPILPRDGQVHYLLTEAQLQQWAIEIYQQALTDAENKARRNQLACDECCSFIASEIASLRDSKKPDQF